MKKILILLIKLLAILSYPIVAQTPISPIDGDGSESNPYEIASIDNLCWLSQTDSIWDESLYFKLTADIDAEETNNWNSGAGFKPIGNKKTKFNGTFNGNGYTITKLYVRIGGSGSRVYTGLFGFLKSGVIENVGLIDGTISSTDSSYSGGIVGYNDSGVISNCYSTGSVKTSYFYYSGGIVGYNKSGTISNCNNTGTVTYSVHTTYSALCSGGIVGYNEGGTISNCYNAGAVTTSSTYSGGVVGYNVDGTIRNCYNSATITFYCSFSSSSGGIAGLSKKGIINNCYNTGTIYDLNSYYRNNSGGIVGWNSEGIIRYCYSSGVIASYYPYTSSPPYRGGIVGKNFNGSMINSYYNSDTSNVSIGIGLDNNSQEANVMALKNVKMKLEESFDNWDFANVWEINEGVTYPSLRLNFVPVIYRVINQTTIKDTPITITTNMVIASDIDGDDLSVVIGAGDDYTVSGMKIIPDSNFTGDLKVPIKMTDQKDTSGVKVMNLYVEALTAIKNITPMGKKGFSIIIAPTPTKDNGSVYISSKESGKVVVTLLSHKGKRISEMKREIIAYKRDYFNWDIISSLLRGTYYVELKVNGKRKVITRLIKTN